MSFCDAGTGLSTRLDRRTQCWRRVRRVQDESREGGGGREDAEHGTGAPAVGDPDLGLRVQAIHVAAAASRLHLQG